MSGSSGVTEERGDETRAEIAAEIVELLAALGFFYRRAAEIVAAIRPLVAAEVAAALEQRAQAIEAAKRRWLNSDADRRTGEIRHCYDDAARIVRGGSQP